MNNIISEKTSKEEWLDNYKNYPSTLQGGLEEKPWYESRILPVFYEIPFKSKVLDIGCNDGTFIEMLKNKRECEVYGIDVSQPMVDLCKQKGLEVYLGDAEQLPFPDDSFDVVTLLEVYLHVVNPKTLLSEINRVLKPNGILLGSSPHKNLERMLWDDKRLHRRYCDEIELKAELKEFFENIDIKVLTGAQFAVGLAGSPIGDKPAEILFKCAISRETHGWGAYLKDKTILRVWFGGTTNPATFYIRMGGVCDKMQLMGAETFYDAYDPSNTESFHRWQLGVGPGTEKGRPANPLIVNDMDQILNVADMSIFQITPQKGCLAFLKAAKHKYKDKPMLVELDDWIFDLPSYNHAALAYQPRSEAEFIAMEQIRDSDGVICSTEYLREMLVKLFPNKKVWVVRNGIDFDIWDNLIPLKTGIAAKEDGTIRIGYTGCDNHVGDLEIVKKPIMAILEEFPNVQIIFPTPNLAWEHNHKQILISDRWSTINNYPHMVKGWDLDIGIAPLRDNHANRAKSNLRWLEYSALKIPTVASSVYPFKNSIKHEEDGIVINNNLNLWYEALKALIVDKRKRTNIGESAYRRVKEEFNMTQIAQEYMSLLKAIKSESLRTAGRSREIVG